MRLPPSPLISTNKDNKRQRIAGVFFVSITAQLAPIQYRTVHKLTWLTPCQFGIIVRQNRITERAISAQFKTTCTGPQPHTENNL